MKSSSRFSVALHVLVHLAQRAGQPVTSADLAACIGTNPVVVRRTMAGLREAGVVASTPGHGGGWTLARPAADVSLRDVYAALGERLLIAVDFAGPAEGGRVARAVAGTLDEFLDDAEALLAARLARITVADLATRVHQLTPYDHARTA